MFVRLSPSPFASDTFRLFNDPQLASFVMFPSFFPSFNRLFYLLQHTIIIINFSLKLNGTEGEMFIASEAGVPWALAIARTQLGASDLGNESRAGCLFAGRLEPQAMDKLGFE
jgi:hypothetical protein